MIKTTRIKYSQAPRIIVDDLSPQCDGVKQTFTLSRPVPEWAPYCLVFNGQLYTNTSYKQWFVLDADRKTIHTSFITPPTQGPNKSLILIVGVAGMEDLGVTWDDIVNKPEILTNAEVDAKDAAVLTEAKEYSDEQNVATLAGANSYADEHDATTLQAAKDYADTQDAATLQAAKDYTDAHSGEGGVAQEYVDQQDAATLQSAKDYSDTKASETLSAANAATQAAITSANVPVITVQSSDPGEGATLAANHFIAVYIDGESE